MRIAILNWRDTSNPEGGGSEVYVEQIAQRLVERGHEVTLVCAAHDEAPVLERRHGFRIVRRGTKLTVYREARRLLRSGALGPLDVIVDTQNGIPFLSPWACDTPAVVLVHHVHREQWPVVYDPVRARFGWWVESVLAPRVYRRRPYIAVSEATRHELAQVGVDPERIHVVHNGVTALPEVDVPRHPHPRIIVLGRLVPHKRVEHVLLAAATLRRDHPGLTVAVVGDGWWAHDLHEQARLLGVDDIVEFTGHVDEHRKAEELARAWMLALPSLKEGWGIVILEAASEGTPAVAYREAGGVQESIDEGSTGLLVDGGVEAFTEALRSLLNDTGLRARMGQSARQRATAFSWEEAAAAFEKVLQKAVDEQERLGADGTTGWRRRRRTANRP